ncbi:MAG: hypothetical protein AAFP20_13875 [Cyanobacteria bacterium J06614_10]
MKPLKVFVVTGLVFAGSGIFALSASAQTLDPAQLEALEVELSIEDYSTADSIFELDPVSVEDRLVDVELFSDPNPNREIEVINEEFDESRGVRGVEIVEFSLPVR